MTTYRPSDKSMEYIARVLPPPALLMWCRVANKAANDGQGHNDCVTAAWAEVHKYYHRPDNRKHYIKRQNGSPPPATIAKAAPRTLYVHRKLINGEALIAWATEQGFKTTLPADDLHVTIAYSRVPLDWDTAPRAEEQTVDVDALGDASDRHLQPLGADGAIVLKFESDILQDRWRALKSAGAVWSYPQYQPHVTISYDAGDIDLDQVAPYDGPLEFGPEVWSEIKDNAVSAAKERAVATGKRFTDKSAPDSLRVIKTADEQRMIYGWAYVNKQKGKAYYDRQGDTIESHELEKAATEFMMDSRLGLAMHERDEDGQIDPGTRKFMLVHSFPMTPEIMKALGITSDYEGWIIGAKVLDDQTWADVKSGKLPALSIGGWSDFEEAA